jgi:hypothetical protein
VISRDAIPSIDDPSFETSFSGSADSRVIVPDLEGAADRAYPIRILDFHEIVNDVLDDLPIAVTWCPLCGTAIVYDRRVEGRHLTFGVSGKLAADNLVMYDRETESAWKQSAGRCLRGSFEGRSLRPLPFYMTTWAQYRSVSEAPRVLAETNMQSEAASSSDSPAPIDYDRDPYRRYLESDGYGLAAHRNEAETRTWNRTDVDPKTPVLGIQIGGEAVGVPRPHLVERGVLTQTIGGQEVVVFGTPSGMYAYEDPGFSYSRESAERFRADGTTWHAVSGEADDGRSLARLPAKREFAFTWQDDHGPDAFFSIGVGIE